MAGVSSGKVVRVQECARVRLNRWNPDSSFRVVKGFSKVGGEECNQFSDREVALGPAADLGDQLMKGQSSTVVFLERLGEDDGVDRREPEVGEESGLLIEGTRERNTGLLGEECGDVVEDLGSGRHGSH